MRLLKKINNNFAFASDAKGEEIIVEGRGIGFQKMPCELTDLKLISRTYYGVDDRYINLLNEIPYQILEIANVIYEYTLCHIQSDINPNLVFTLADHINFSVQRWEKNIHIKMPLFYDLQQLYPLEIEIADYALKLIQQHLNIYLPEEEKSGIALNIINSELNIRNIKEEDNFDDWISKSTSIIEDSMGIKISKNSFNYSRFITHMRYLFKRVKESKSISSDNLKIYLSLKSDFPRTNECVEKIQDYLRNSEGLILDEEEILYLILHINRLCSNEVLFMAKSMR